MEMSPKKKKTPLRRKKMKSLLQQLLQLRRQLMRRPGTLVAAF